MVTIPARFNGPDTSGNGGWTSALIAAQLDAEIARVRLQSPPPLATELTWRGDESEMSLVDSGGTVIGTARPGEFERDTPAFVDSEQVAHGLAHYPGFHTHPFDRCFTCGTARAEGDGLRIFSGPIGQDTTAAPWHVFEDFAEDVRCAWAALDCPGGWAADFQKQTMVLGQMTAAVHRLPRAGETLHATGRLSAREGRKFITDTALYTPEGELLGRAEQIWIEIDIADFS